MGFDFDVIERSLPYLFRDGMTFTVTLTLLAMTGGIIFGTLLAMMRLSVVRTVPTSAPITSAITQAVSAVARVQTRPTSR